MSTTTLAEMAASCRINLAAARDHLRHVRRLVATEKPGPELNRLRHQLSRFTSDVEHWTEQEAYYAARCTEEGETTVPRVIRAATVERPAERKPVRQEPDRRLPREREDEE